MIVLLLKSSANAVFYGGSVLSETRKKEEGKKEGAL
jgi:hypothetical protein